MMLRPSLPARRARRPLQTPRDEHDGPVPLIRPARESVSGTAAALTRTRQALGPFPAASMLDIRPSGSRLLGNACVTRRQAFRRIPAHPQVPIIVVSCRPRVMEVLCFRSALSCAFIDAQSTAIEPSQPRCHTDPLVTSCPRPTRVIEAFYPRPPRRSSRYRRGTGWRNHRPASPGPLLPVWRTPQITPLQTPVPIPGSRLPPPAPCGRPEPIRRPAGNRSGRGWSPEARPPWARS
jgi:hypothetical protein